MKETLRNIILIIILILIIVMISIDITYGKYTYNFSRQMATIDITDEIAPTIQIEDVGEKYINLRENTIDLKIKVEEENISEQTKISSDKIIVSVGSKVIGEESKTLTLTEEKLGELIYNLNLHDIEDEGEIVIDIRENSIQDKYLNANTGSQIHTNIFVDNTPPQLTSEKESIGKKINFIIKSNEIILVPTGWELSEDGKTINKIFDSNISYVLSVSDRAGNTSQMPIDIHEATYIELKYASHNSEVGWSYGYTNYSIAGNEAINRNPKYKTESLIFNVTGNVDEDFVEGQAYVYSYWNPPEQGRCKTTGNLYTTGYSGWKSMKSSETITLNGVKYFQLGGTGINAAWNKNTNGQKPIPYNLAINYTFGICGISFRLKSYEEYSIVYQIYVNGHGWLAPASDGEETMYSKTSPISAFRVALIPKSEKQEVLDNWGIK